MPTTQPDYRLTFRPLPGYDGPPPIIRVRRLLKIALRLLGLRCIEAKEVARGDAA
jgi:hypothetical protein